ncbi:MAG: NmrA/HSCARG family protein [Gammaproteobacteria bacterium]|nr:NmrA/HSCARG family protein [Gammaproteobacteria bacterium]
MRAILDDPDRQFAVRAVTRDKKSDRARELASLGAEVVQANLDDVASLKRAFSGAFGTYCVTNYWEHFSPEKETQQAINLAEAAKAAKLQHVIWSTFEDTRKWVPLDDTRMPTLMGKYKVPHFDAKAVANQVFRDLGVPTTMLLTSFYWDNLIYFGMGPQKGPDNVYTITLPMAERRLPGIARDDIGRCAYGIFKAGTKYIDRTVGIAGEHLTGADMAAALTEALGVPVRYNAISADAYRSLGFPGADDLGNMFQFKRDFNGYYCGARDVARSRALNPSLQTFAMWLEKNKDLIPL